MTGLRGLWRSARLDNGASHPKRAAEAYPRAGGKRVVRDVWAFYGTEALFKKAGFRKVRGDLPVPKGWTPRVHDARHLCDAANVMRWTARDGRA